MPVSLVQILSDISSEDPLNAGGERRKFYLPLAAIPPYLDNSEISDEIHRIEAIDWTNYQLRDVNKLPHDEPILEIIIPVPSGGFVNLGGRDDPTYRLHAVTSGILTFEPATGTHQDQLILEMPVFSTMDTTRIKWWQRWVEADCIPHKFIYENVDKAHLETMLIALPIDLEGNTPEHQRLQLGLTFPNEVTDEASKGVFIAEFLRGTPGTRMSVESGAYIGRCTDDSAAISNPHPKKLNIKVQYADNHFMNPREFLYLLFGDDSLESTVMIQNFDPHPLLKSMDQTANTQGAELVETRRMYLRPPLRTFYRVRWEAKWEFEDHELTWRFTTYPADPITNRYYNTKDVTSFNDDFLEVPGRGNANKCNLFVSDIVIRAGYRVPVFEFPKRSGNYSYFLANKYASLVTRAHPYGTKQIPAKFTRNGTNIARRWDSYIVNVRPIRDRVTKINSMINDEGRCFILVIERSHIDSPGHLAILDNVVGPPYPIWEDNLSGLKKIKGDYFEALGDGASHTIGDTMKPVNEDTEDDLLLIELYPGKDPDTKYGLNDLNVR